MANECQTYPGDINAGYFQAFQLLGPLQSKIDDIHTYWCTWSCATQRDRLSVVLTNIWSMLAYIITGTATQSPPLRVPYMLSNCIGGVVDMDAIINAMLVAKFDQLQSFIGLVDAYRVALWNAPFNADFYAALARGFMKWP
jgi:hypothetical protein